ncbi:MAG: ABC transporter permease [Candidatus Saccharimonadales bacterium]
MIASIFNKENRALLSELVRTDFKLRYQGSVLGYAWSLLRPLLLFIILYIVFVKFLKLGAGVPHYPIYLLLGIVIWNFFTELTVQSLGSIVERGDLLRKIRIPRWIIVLSTSVAALINLLLNLIVVFIFLFFNHVDLLKSSLWLPLILFEVYVFAVGISLFLSAFFVKYRDVKYIWEVVLQAGFYLTPILYPLARITNLTFQKLIMINPMAQTIQDARYALVTHESPTVYRLFKGGWHEYIPFIIVLLVLMMGLLYFKKEARYFAENV